MFEKCWNTITVCGAQDVKHENVRAHSGVIRVCVRRYTEICMCKPIFEVCLKTGVPIPYLNGAVVCSRLPVGTHIASGLVVGVLIIRDSYYFIVSYSSHISLTPK